MQWSCSKAARWRRPTNLIAAIAAVVLACLVSPAARADSAPDWLRAAARQKTDNYDKDTIAVTLLDETQITVQDNGEIQTLHRGAVRLLRPEAKDEYGYMGVPFDDETKINYFNVWTIMPDGRELALKDKNSVERSVTTYEVFSSLKEKIQAFPEAKQGSVVGFEYVQRGRPYVFEDNWWFQDKIPVKEARLTLRVPSGWEFTADWFNYPRQEPLTQGSNQYTWEVKDLPAVETEDDMPAWKVVAGWVGIKYFPRDPALRAKTTGSWKDVGLWFEGLESPRRVASPEIKQKVAELTAGMTDPGQKIRALAAYVQRNIRYVAIEVGIGGWQPHSAGDVFAHQYGDCKDKSTLLNTMLRESGIESYSVSIDTRRGIVHPNYPSISMDHAILAIRLPDSVNDPLFYSVVEVPNLGRLLIFDPTNEYVPLGYLPSYLQGSYALIMNPEGGTLVSLPVLPPSSNRLLRTAKFSLNPRGDLSGEVHELRWGGPATEDREAFIERQPAKRAEVIENFLGSFLNNYALMGATLQSLNQYDQSLGVDYKFVSQGYANIAGDMLIVRPRVVGDKYTKLLTLFTQDKPRKYPLSFDVATREDDLFDITIPAGYAVDGLPQPVQADCPFATYHSETKVADGVLHYKRTLEIKDVTVSTEKLPVLKTFLQQIAADQSSTAILRRTAP